jgi:hypothetical protein
MWEEVMTDEELIESLRLWNRDDAADRIEALTKERDEALWQAKCHEATLDAWFDRRELGHAAVDQAVVDAASGYLRTSRVGGMTNKQSDMILGVIQDMARLGLFADLFARAALKPAPVVTAGWPTEEGEGSIIVGNVKGESHD